MAENVSLAAAVQSHSKLITYTAEHIDYQYKQVLEYAGLLSYMDEQVYIDINKLLTK
jgi:regulation of enolase protein 1 (concanavalin A-like superfamily)